MRPAYGFVVSAALTLTGCCTTCGDKCPFSWTCGKGCGAVSHSAAKPLDGGAASSGETIVDGANRVGEQGDGAQPPNTRILATTDDRLSVEYGSTANPPLPGSSSKISTISMVPPPPAGISGFATDLDLSATRDAAGSASSQAPWHAAPLPPVSTAHDGDDALPVVVPTADNSPAEEFRRKTIGVTDTLPRSTYAPVAD